MHITQPTTLGLKKSFGFGDRLGLATAGHLAAARKFGFAPIFAQQSIRELDRTQRSPKEVIQAAANALAQLGYDGAWGADADHLKLPEDVHRTAAAGFCFFTIDPSAHVNNNADQMTLLALGEAVKQMEQDGVFPDSSWRAYYLSQAFEISSDVRLRFTDDSLFRAAVKYARAIAFTTDMSQTIASANEGRAYEMEISVDETSSPTTPLEHLFVALELKRRGVNVISLAPRFIGDFEKGIDYHDDLHVFETLLRQHEAIAKFCGPYKISVHSGSDKFAVYPILGRVCGDLLHVKTAGTSYLEALRVVARTAPELFAPITAFCRGRFETDRQSYHISTTGDEVASLPPFCGPDEEDVYLNKRVGRQLLHVTFGSVLTTGQDTRGRSFKEIILSVLERHADLHQELLEDHFTRHFALLEQG